MHRVLGMVSLLNLGVAVSLGAQQLEPMFAPWELPATSLAPETMWGANRRDTALVPRGDYRYEGLALGGISLGVLGAYVGSQLSAACPTVPGAQCNTDRLGNAVALGLTAAAVGGGLGYLVGRLSSKVQRPAAAPLRTLVIPDSTRRRVGYHHWKGAAIGSGSGALLGALLMFGLRGSCSDCDLTHDNILKMGVLGAGFGGAVGFLVGLASPKYESPLGQATSE